MLSLFYYDQKKITIKFANYSHRLDILHNFFSSISVQRCSLVRIGGIPEPFAQDQTVPIAVGSTVAVVSVMVVLGYALWRNLSTRKTEYDTME